MANAKKPTPRRAASSGQAKPNHATAAANTAVAITLAAPEAGRRNSVKYLNWSYSAAPAGGRLSVTDATVVVLDIDITLAGSGSLSLTDGFQTTLAASAVVATLAAGGAGVIGKLNVGSLVE